VKREALRRDAELGGAMGGEGGGETEFPAFDEAAKGLT